MPSALGLESFRIFILYDESWMTLVLYRKRTARRFRLASTSGGSLSIQPSEERRSRVRRTRSAMGIQSISA